MIAEKDSVLKIYHELYKTVTTETGLLGVIGTVLSIGLDRIIDQNGTLIQQNNKILASLDVVRHPGISPEVSTAAAKQAKAIAKAPRSL
jgi:hypothetical protein